VKFKFYVSRKFKEATETFNGVEVLCFVPDQNGGVEGYGVVEVEAETREEAIKLVQEAYP